MRVRHKSFLGLLGAVFGVVILVRNQDTFNTLLHQSPPQELHKSLKADPRNVLAENVCKPSTRIAFVKVHKAGSSTVANILQRFGYSRDLNFVVPRKRDHEFGYNYIGQRGDTVRRENILPPRRGESFDILWNHVTYNHDAFREIMPRETRYISILREPFEQFVSAFEYYVIGRKRNNLTSTYNINPIAVFLDNANIVMDITLRDHLLNSQSIDLGFNNITVLNTLRRVEYLERLSVDFDLVLMMEYFDESIVLLKRTMCWSLFDILYIPLNKNPRKKRWLFRQEHYEKHKRNSFVDYELYNHFRKIFWVKIWKEGPDFFEEVRYFKGVLRKLGDYCALGRELVVPDSRWGRGFVVRRHTCAYIQMQELHFYDKIRKRAYQKIDADKGFH